MSEGQLLRVALSQWFYRSCDSALFDFCLGGTRWGRGGRIVSVPRLAFRWLLIGQAVTMLHVCDAVLCGSVGRGGRGYDDVGRDAMASDAGG